MTYAPQPLLDLRAYLRPLTGLSDAEMGIVPDKNHNGGYHCGWSQRSSDNDYSWSESSRDWSHKTEAASAFDLGMFSQLRDVSVWIVEQCQAGASDTLDIREIIYSPDGKVVLRWDRLGIRTTGDPSHLTHTHFSWFRDAENRDKTAVFQRFFEGDYVANYGPLGEPPHLADYNRDFPDTMVADVFSGLVQGGTAWGSPQDAAKNWFIYKVLNDIGGKLDALAAGGGVAVDEDRLREIIREEIAKTKLV